MVNRGWCCTVASLSIIRVGESRPDFFPLFFLPFLCLSLSLSPARFLEKFCVNKEIYRDIFLNRMSHVLKYIIF